MLVTITHLEMTAPSQLRVKAAPSDRLCVVRVEIPNPEFNRFFYTAIGADWHWFERLVWTEADWDRHANRPELQTWLIVDNGLNVGYFELEKQPGDDVEIVYFGVLRQYLERKIGGWALSEAVRRAWQMDARRVWVHTCTLDHARALPNYLARGFRVFKTETKEEMIPGKLN